MTEAFLGGLLGGIVGLFGMGIGLGINNRIMEKRRREATVAAIEASQARIATLIGLVVADESTEGPVDPTEVN